MLKIKFKNYKISIIFLSIVVAIATGVLMVSAGSLNPTSAPGDTMHSLEEIYCKITGCSPTNYELDSPGTPTAYPDTMRTLEEIYDIIPDFEGAPGNAVEGDVCGGREFYSDSGEKLTGTRTNCSPGRTQGQVCTDSAQCVTGYCVDGYCCNSASCGTCQACNVAGSLGTCQYVADGAQAGGCTAQCYACDSSHNCVARTNASNAYGCTGAGRFCYHGKCSLRIVNQYPSSASCTTLCANATNPGAPFACVDPDGSGTTYYGVGLDSYARDGHVKILWWGGCSDLFANANCGSAPSSYSAYGQTSCTYTTPWFYCHCEPQ